MRGLEKFYFESVAPRFWVLRGRDVVLLCFCQDFLRWCLRESLLAIDSNLSALSAFYVSIRTKYKAYCLYDCTAVVLVFVCLSTYQ